MRLLLICPTNIDNMPYYQRYLRISHGTQVSIQTIVWDRLNTSPDCIAFKDKRAGYRRSPIEYYNYARFIRKTLKNIKFDRIIIFGLHLSFFLQKTLMQYRGKYIIDIRDLHPIMYFIDFKSLFGNAHSVILSSGYFKNYLPKYEKYYIDHNVSMSYEQIQRFYDVPDTNIHKIDEKHVNSIAYIGSLRDKKTNIQLLHALGNNPKYQIIFHGDGISYKSLVEYSQKHNFQNVSFGGRYEKIYELSLYDNATFINILIPNSSINNRALLPNRLYNACISHKPIIALRNTYVSKIVLAFSLGIVINKLCNIEMELSKYISSSRSPLYREFWAWVGKDMVKFLDNYQRFLREVAD